MKDLKHLWLIRVRFDNCEVDNFLKLLKSIVVRLKLDGCLIDIG